MGRSLLTLLLPGSAQLLKLFLKALDGVLDLCAPLRRVFGGSVERQKADFLDIDFSVEMISLGLVLGLVQPGGRLW